MSTCYGCNGTEGLGATFYSGGRQVPQYGVPALTYRGYGAAAPSGHVYPAWTNAGLFERAGLSPDHAVVASYVLRAGGVGAAAFHGYRRNHSVGWAIGWALLGGIFPVITTGIAVAQGFGKPASK